MMLINGLGTSNYNKDIDRPLEKGKNKSHW